MAVSKHYLLVGFQPAVIRAARAGLERVQVGLVENDVLTCTEFVYSSGYLSIIGVLYRVELSLTSTKGTIRVRPMSVYHKHCHYPPLPSSFTRSRCVLRVVMNNVTTRQFPRCNTVSCEFTQ